MPSHVPFVQLNKQTLSSDLCTRTLGKFSQQTSSMTPSWCVAIAAMAVVSVSPACLARIQPAHCAAILISHSESMRVWVCVTNSNGISIYPKPWVVAPTDARSDNSPWHQWKAPAKLTLRRGKEDKSSSLKCLFSIRHILRGTLDYI